MISLPQTMRPQRIWLSNASTNSPQRFSDKGALIRSWRDSSSTMEYAWFARWYQEVFANAKPLLIPPSSSFLDQDSVARLTFDGFEAAFSDPPQKGRHRQGSASFSLAERIAQPIAVS